jgi:hypothetical protein
MRFGLEPTLPLPFHQLVAYCLELGRESREFDDRHVTRAKSRISEIEKQQDKDKKKDYVETIKLETEILAELALNSSEFEELIPPDHVETFKYIGEGKPLKRKRKSNKKDIKKDSDQLENQADDELVNKESNINSEFDDLPNYDVSFLGGVE